MDYYKISKTIIGQIYKTYQSFDESSLSLEIRMLVAVRTSQINGCAYCCRVHSEEARKAKIEQAKLDMIPGWKNATTFSDKERAVLNWCERVTQAKSGSEQDKAWLEKYLSELQIVDLTAYIAVINTLNRIAISLREY